jgi:hypothetical protein
MTSPRQNHLPNKQTNALMSTKSSPNIHGRITTDNECSHAINSNDFTKLPPSYITRSDHIIKPISTISRSISTRSRTRSLLKPSKHCLSIQLSNEFYCQTATSHPDTIYKHKTMKLTDKAKVIKATHQEINDHTNNEA